SYVTPLNLHSFPTRRSSDLDDLKQRIESSGLQGFFINLVWASDSEEEAEMFRASDVNPSFRVTDRSDFEQHIENHFGLSHERMRSEEHTSELQSRFDIVCRL